MSTWFWLAFWALIAGAVQCAALFLTRRRLRILRWVVPMFAGLLLLYAMALTGPALTYLLAVAYGNAGAGDMADRLLAFVLTLLSAMGVLAGLSSLVFAAALLAGWGLGWGVYASVNQLLSGGDKKEGAYELQNEAL